MANDTENRTLVNERSHNQISRPIHVGSAGTAASERFRRDMQSLSNQPGSHVFARVPKAMPWVTRAVAIGADRLELQYRARGALD
ncbi:hypothetical protein [Bradyrhizobium sp. CB2312]|uniref:hypothetical protein n=1 Tax=Bradyrhizobium sp. CB2312 TaxID=3039155 RepID=UPI0024B063BD|nr:hypothetical protein [Bradyrhizobium sp. CB2312]WFU71204.1 hypothetical protein QA642_39200 [Bradyrhizobium sp. CB2312]